MEQSAIYAGTFDPLTLGHMDVIERAIRIFDRLIVAVSESRAKRPAFDLEERLGIVREAVTPMEQVEVTSFNGLLVDYARQRGIHVLIRGLRAISDFEFEFQMALMNRKMTPEIETIFLMPKEEYSYLSSSTVREIAELGGDVSRFVPEATMYALTHKFGGLKK